MSVFFWSGPFVYFHTSCARTAKALARLRECANSHEPSLVAYVIWAGSFLFVTRNRVLHQTSSLGETGGISWELVLCLLLAWLIVFLVLTKGIKTLGKVIIRILLGCEVRIEKSVRWSLFGITRLCRVMPNSDHEGRRFLSVPNNHDKFFFLHTLWSPAFGLNESHSYTLTSAILKVDVVFDVAVTRPPTCRIRVCKVRFFSTGENCGDPCLVCKKKHSDSPVLCYLPDVEAFNIHFL